MSERRRMMTKKSDTLVLCHFDNDYVDEAGNIVLVGDSSFTHANYENGLIGGKAIRIPSGILTSELSLDGNDFTIDMWIKADSNIGDWNWCFRFAQNANTNNCVYIAHRSRKIYFTYPNNSNHFTNYSAGYKHHCAVVYDNVSRTLSFYVDGSLFKTIYNASFPSGIYLLNFRSNATVMDEFRLSKCKRWNANFTPPTEPYTL